MGGFVRPPAPFKSFSRGGGGFFSYMGLLKPEGARRAPEALASGRPVFFRCVLVKPHGAFFCHNLLVCLSNFRFATKTIGPLRRRIQGETNRKSEMKCVSIFKIFKSIFAGNEDIGIRRWGGRGGLRAWRPEPNRGRNRGGRDTEGVSQTSLRPGLRCRLSEGERF